MRVVVGGALLNVAIFLLLQDLELGCSSHIVANYRVLWLDLSELLQKLGNAYARTYSTYSLFMITNITIAVRHDSPPFCFNNRVFILGLWICIGSR